MNIAFKVFLSFVLLQYLVKSEKRVIYIKSEVAFNATYLEDHAVIISTNGTTLDILLNIRATFRQDPWLIVALAKRNAKTKTYTPILSYDFNVCQFLGRKNHNDKMNLMQTWFENYWKQGNMPRTCPIKKGNYYWKGMRLDRSSLPPFLQLGLYRTTVKSYFKANPQYQLFYASVTNVSIYGLYKNFKF